MILSKKIQGQSIVSGFEMEFKEIQDKINARKQPPTKEQIAELKSLLKGFGCKSSLHIPEFISVVDMDTWRRRKIKEILE